jgi:hypothetical protein
VGALAVVETSLSSSWFLVLFLSFLSLFVSWAAVVAATAGVVAARVTSGAAKNRKQMKWRAGGDERVLTGSSSSRSSRRGCGWNCICRSGIRGEIRGEEAESAAVVDFESETFTHCFRV